MKKKILVVDDEPSLRGAIVLSLKSKGFDVLEAENGMTGSDLAQEHKPDLIITDVYMDNMNGFMMIDMLQEDPSTAKIPIIVMSSLAQTAGAWNSNATIEYLQKPFLNSTLMQTVDKMLKK